MQNFSKACFYDECEDWNFWQVVVSEEVQVWYLKESIHNTLFNGLLKAADRLDTDLLPKLIYKASSDVLDYSWRSSFFKLFNIGNKVVIFLIDEEDGTASNPIWNFVVKQSLCCDENPR